MLAITPVLMPFGTPFAQDGNNSIASNWAFYFWYTPIGWGAVWIKIVLWNCELWDRDFFMPFMQLRSGFFLCNGTLAAVVNTTIFSVALYLCGYLIFHNPVPIGTISFGVPCFLVVFINMYFLVVPASFRQSWPDHVRLLRCWSPFVIWVAGLVIHTCILWLQQFHFDASNTALYISANVGVQALFIIVREGMDKIPLESLMGDVNLDLSLLWGLAYSAMCSTMSDSIFPALPSNAVGILTTAGVLTFNVVMNLVAFWKATDVSEVIFVLMNNTCDVISVGLPHAIQLQCLRAKR